MFGLGCTKTRSPRIGTVLHLRPPDVHIFDTNLSLVENSIQHFYQG